MQFSGRFQRRSSDGRKNVVRPPGETEIQRLNPKRESDILSVTGWETLADGSLNLAVEQSVVEALARLTPTLDEPATGIVYPPPYENIPKIRKAYWYYAGTARRGERAESVLVRRAMVPVPNTVELFAAESLTTAFNLVPNDVVSVEIHATEKVSKAAS